MARPCDEKQRAELHVRSPASLRVHAQRETQDGHRFFRLPRAAQRAARARGRRWRRGGAASWRRGIRRSLRRACRRAPGPARAARARRGVGLLADGLARQVLGILAVRDGVIVASELVHHLRDREVRFGEFRVAQSALCTSSRTHAAAARRPRTRGRRCGTPGRQRCGRGRSPSPPRRSRRRCGGAAQGGGEVEVEHAGVGLDRDRPGDEGGGFFQVAELQLGDAEQVQRVRVFGVFWRGCRDRRVRRGRFFRPGEVSGGVEGGIRNGVTHGTVVVVVVVVVVVGRRTWSPRR